MSDGSSDEEFEFQEVAAPSDGEETVDDESLSSALRLLNTPSAGEAAQADAAAGQPGGAAAAPEARDVAGRLEVRRVRGVVRHGRALHGQRAGLTGFGVFFAPLPRCRPGAGRLCAQLPARGRPEPHPGAVRDGVV
jgi:hypothetical protein